MSDELLDKVAEVLKEHPELTKIEVQGHTDNKGLAKANEMLSQQRADAVMKALVKRGIDARRLTAKGYGQNVPIATNDTDEGRQKNRRVQFKIIEKAPEVAMRSIMKKPLQIACSTIMALLAVLSGTARADFTVPRYQVDQKGDFVLIGNTLGFDCSSIAGIPAPVVGTVGACGLNTNDTALDVFWRSDSPANGQANADIGVTAAQARTTAILDLPAGATVTKAFLYWSAKVDPPGLGDPQVTVDRPGGFSANVDAIQTYNINPQGNLFFYQSVADVTALVQAQGSGAYRVSGVSAGLNVSVPDNFSYAAWWMAVFYTLPTDQPRNLALFDGLDPVFSNPGVTTSISGFLVPNAGFNGKLGVIAFEGDNTNVGDELRFKGNALSDALNPADNFFNGTRSILGAPVSKAGDLPQLTGGVNSMAGVDFDVVDVKNFLPPGRHDGADPAPTPSATSTSSPASSPRSPPSGRTSATSDKTAVDLNGGALFPGDVLEYTIVAVNSGNDASVNTVLTDVLPAGVTYVPGSLQITAGDNIGAKTDGAGDDQGEYDAATKTLTVRLGAGANAAMGGTIAVNASSTVNFRVTVDDGASGAIQNQAAINAAGQHGAPPSNAVTDGNGAVAGAPPTTVVIDQCLTDMQCSAPTPHCFTAPNPNVCVECFLDNHCLNNLEPSCDSGHQHLRLRLGGRGGLCQQRRRGLRRRARQRLRLHDRLGLRRPDERQGLRPGPALHQRLPRDERQRLRRRPGLHLGRRHHRPVRRVPGRLDLRRPDERHRLRRRDQPLHPRLPRDERERLYGRELLLLDGCHHRRLFRLRHRRELRRPDERSGLRHRFACVRPRLPGDERQWLYGGRRLHLDGRHHRPMRAMPRRLGLRWPDERQGLRRDHDDVHRRLPRDGRQRLYGGRRLHLDGRDHRSVRRLPGRLHLRRREERPGL